MNVAEAAASPLFSNGAINRVLNKEGVLLVLDALSVSGHVEWLDEAKERCLVMWRSPGEWVRMTSSHARAST